MGVESVFRNWKRTGTAQDLLIVWDKENLFTQDMGTSQGIVGHPRASTTSRRRKESESTQKLLNIITDSS